MYDAGAYDAAYLETTGRPAGNGFGYSPHFFPIALMTNIASYENARVMWKVICLSCAFFMFWIAVQFSSFVDKQREDQRLPHLKPFVIATVAALNPFTRHILMNSQFSLWVLLFLTSGWFLTYRK